MFKMFNMLFLDGPLTDFLGAVWGMGHLEGLLEASCLWGARGGVGRPLGGVFALVGLLGALSAKKPSTSSKYAL